MEKKPKPLEKQTKKELHETIGKLLTENEGLLSKNQAVRNTIHELSRNVMHLRPQLDSKWNPAYTALAIGIPVGGICGYFLKGTFA